MVGIKISHKERTAGRSYCSSKSTTGYRVALGMLSVKHGETGAVSHAQDKLGNNVGFPTVTLGVIWDMSVSSNMRVTSNLAAGSISGDRSHMVNLDAGKLTLGNLSVERSGTGAASHIQ
eukprot:1161636-Pelagomonas_calceolata.AAC.1